MNNNHPVLASLGNVLQADQIAVSAKSKAHYRKGWRSGEGDALAVLFPNTLRELWEALKVCVSHNCIIIMQAANTGLTEGSTPSGSDYDRDVVVINTLAMDTIIPMGDAEQIISFPGATLHQLESQLKLASRAPHSVIGSSCLGASIVGGVANNSGGALVKRGPAYTELSLFAWVNEKGELELVNHLGIDLGETPEEIISNLESGNFSRTIEPTDKVASAKDYVEKIRDVDADTPSRYNADESKLYEASGCAGKLAVFAVRLDTFNVPKRERTYYVGTNDPNTLAQLRRHILSQFDNLPEVGEYLHRDIFDIAQTYGKDTFLSVKHLGTQRLPKLFALKGKLDQVFNHWKFVPNSLTDRAMQFASRLFPGHLPDRIIQYRQKYEHHLILKMSDDGIGEADKYLAEFFKDGSAEGDYFVCNADEASSAYLHRFAAAGAAVRYQTMHEKELGEIIALDIALRRNDLDWVEKLPPEIMDKIDKQLYYGHFFCHVFHQDYVLKKGVDPKQLKKELLSILDARGAKYPAEHNVGHLYKAESQLQKFYQRLDPTNTFNPGIGGDSKHKRNCSCCL